MPDELMNKEQLIQYYHRFCRWQQAEPHYVNRHEGEVRHCHNCGTEFSDNFCPRCGQRAEVGRVGWRSIRNNIALLWGLDSRSLSCTLVQLLGRPGYLVRDYISGHRQVSFPPVKMLVLVCLSVVIFESVFHLENDVISMNFKDEKIDSVVAWINAQKSWATLLYQSLCWSTLWRLVVVLLSHLVVIVTIAVVVLVLFIYQHEESNAIFLLIIAAVVLLAAVMLLVTHRINKRAINQER